MGTAESSLCPSCPHHCQNAPTFGHGPEDPAVRVWSRSRWPLSRSRLSSRTLCSGSGVGDELVVDGVADAMSEGAKGFFRALVLGEFALVVGPAGCVVRDLSDRRDVQRVVQLAVASGVESVPDFRSAGRFDRGGPVVTGGVTRAREPGHVAGVTDDQRRADRADPVRRSL